jgi:hypothetical protein
MLHRLRARATFSNTMSIAAVMIALGGTSYAAFKLPDDSVKSRNIVDGQVKTADLAHHAVRNAQVATNSLKGSAIAQTTLYKCEAGDIGLENRNFCARIVHETAGNYKDWASAIQVCRSQGDTPARLPTAAEFFAFTVGAPGGTEAFRNVDVWTADPAVPGPTGGNPPSAWSVSADSNGDPHTFAYRPISSQLHDVACVYGAADVK